ncbi:HAMP domain-containing histidine kinase [bacterium]|nr:HAMP domain-containing histidine kinase [bacterium]
MIRLPGVFRKIRTRLVVIYVTLTAAIFAVLGTFFFYIASEGMDQEMGRRLNLVARLAASRLDVPTLRSLRAGDEQSAAYLRLVGELQDLLDIGAAARIYVLDKDYNRILDTTKAAKIGQPLFLAYNDTEIQRAFEGAATDSTVFTGVDDQLYKSAYAPIYQDREVVAVVGVDAGVVFFDTLKNIKRDLALMGLSAILVILAVSVVLAVGFERPIARLVQSAKRMGEGDLEAPIVAGTRDEIGFLAQSLETARENLVQRDRNLQMLQRGIAHEVRNPLGGMRLFCDILTDELTGDEQALSYVDKIRREVTNLENVVNEFLDYTREIRLEIRPVDVGQFFSELLATYGDWGHRKIGVHLGIEPAAATAHFDPDQLRRAFFNLINNAIQAMPEGGELTITVSPGEERWIVTVADTGIGVKPQDMQHMFTPFHTTKDKGTGLGLPFAKKIVEHHGGRIGLESEPGVGTVVTISLPQDETRTTTRP